MTEANEAGAQSKLQVTPPPQHASPQSKDRAFQVSLESPQCGFMSLSLTDARAEKKIRMGAACEPHDSLHELIEALIRLLDGAREQIVRWNCEPEQYDFHLTIDGDAQQINPQINLRVVRFPDGRRLAETSEEVFNVREDRVRICQEFWRELRTLKRRSDTDVFRQNWRREFPDAELSELTKRLRALKRERRVSKL